MLKNDVWFNKVNWDVISPFAEGIKRPGKVSYGVSSYGYDIRVANEFLVADPIKMYNTIGALDPKRFEESLFERVVTDDHIVIPPHGFALAKSLEYIRVPRDVLVVCLGKSTYARVGLVLNVTPLEPEWIGFITLEMSNTTPYPVHVYANEGIGQLLFFGVEEVCSVSYADKKGKYQDQRDITLPKVD